MFLNLPATFNDHSAILDASGQRIDLPLYHVLSKPHEKREVVSLPPSTESELAAPSSVFHSFTQSSAGQDILTMWDTGALLSLVPMSTVTDLNLTFVSTSDVAFVVANGSRMQPLWYCPNMRFSIANHHFVDKVYVVPSAPFQLLLCV